MCRWRRATISHKGNPTGMVHMMRMPPFRGVLIMSTRPWSTHDGGTTHLELAWNTVGSTKRSRKVLLVRMRSVPWRPYSQMNRRKKYGWWMDGCCPFIHPAWWSWEIMQQLIMSIPGVPRLHIWDWSKISKSPSERWTKSTMMSWKPLPGVMRKWGFYVYLSVLPSIVICYQQNNGQ